MLFARRMLIKKSLLLNRLSPLKSLPFFHFFLRSLTQLCSLAWEIISLKYSFLSRNNLSIVEFSSDALLLRKKGEKKQERIEICSKWKRLKTRSYLSISTHYADLLQVMYNYIRCYMRLAMQFKATFLRE